MQHNAWQADEPLDPSVWIPLSTLALEGFGSGSTVENRTKRLANDLAEEVIYDDIGRACVPRTVARSLFLERTEREQREAARRNQSSPTAGDQLRARVQALQARERIELDGADLPTSALAQMTAGDITSRLQQSGQRMDEYLGGGLTYHRITQDKE